MRDLLVGAGALGDVFDGGNPPAALQRLVDDLDRPAAWSLRELTRAFSERYVLDDRVAEFIDVAVKGSGFLAMRDQPLHGAALFDHLRRQAEHLDVTLVADDDPSRRVVKHEALRDIVHGDAEVSLLHREPPARQPVTLQQQADEDGEDDGNRKQYAFAPAPGRHSRAKQDRRRQRGAKGRPSDPPGRFSGTRRTVRRLIAAIDTHLVPSQRENLRMTDGRRVTTCS